MNGTFRHFRSDTDLEDELGASGTSSLVALSASFLNEPCDSDAEDELLPGLVDNPGTTRRTKLSVFADDGFSRLWSIVAFDR